MRYTDAMNEYQLTHPQKLNPYSRGNARIVGVRFPDVLYHYLADMAKEQGVSVSAMLRLLVHEETLRRQDK